MAEYEFRRGVRVSGVTADATYTELMRIREEDDEKRLAPQAVVDAARPEDAVLHPAFEWDDTIAGEQYRLSQSRQLIRAVYPVREPTATEPPSPIFVHIEPQNYQPTELVVARIDLFEQALFELHRQLRMAERSVRELERAARAGGDPDRMATVALAVAAFDTVREAIDILR